MSADNTSTTVSRDFKGIWIPREIWLDNRLGFFEKCLFAEIDSLCGPDGCYASNEYFANFFQMKERRIQDGLSLLKSLGYVFQVSFDGRTRVLRTNDPKNRNAEFSTSEVQKNAPLACNILHPSHIIENKAYSKEQQQAAVSSQEKKLYPCLVPVDIPDSDKYQIQNAYAEQIVQDAIAWALHPETKINKTLAQAIKWGCKEKIKPPTPPQEIEKENAAAAAEISKSLKHSNTMRLDLLSKHVEIVFTTCQKDPIVISYSENGFKDILMNNLRKLGLI